MAVTGSDVIVGRRADPSPLPSSAAGRSRSIGAVTAAAWVGLSAAQFVGSLSLLPRVVERVTAGGGGKVGVAGVLLALGAVVGMVAGVGIGMLSDRTGRRRPWIRAGTVIAPIGLLLLPAQQSLPAIAVSWVIVQIGLAMVVTGVAVLVPDHVPRARLGWVSALGGVGQLVGAVIGTGLVALPGIGLAAGAVLVSVVMVVLVAPAGLVRTGDMDVRRAPPAGGGGHGGSYRDVWLAGTTRFLATLSHVMLMGFLFYYLADAIYHPDPTAAQFYLVVVCGVGLTASALISARVSDRRQRRKAIVVASMVVMAAADLLLLGWTSWPTTVAAAAVFGLGYGAYLAVDAALIVEVLPRRDRYARDLGLLGMAIAIPQIVGPAIAAPLIAGAGFGTLYAVAAVVTAAGALAVVPIRTVR